MSFKEIWSDFWNKTKANAKSAWDSMKSAAKASFKLLKSALIDFIGAFFSWVWSVIQSAGTIILEMIKTIFSFLGASIKSTLGLIYEKVIAWINKW